MTIELPTRQTASAAAGLLGTTLALLLLSGCASIPLSEHYYGPTDYNPKTGYPAVGSPWNF